MARLLTDRLNQFRLMIQLGVALLAMRLLFVCLKGRQIPIGMRGQLLIY
jgi:hypothetical protein